MTEKEAIKEIKRWSRILMSAGSQCVLDTAEAQNMAIKALEEIQQYREIGTVEEVKNQKHNLGVAYKIINDYQQIGTVEECREVVEKQKPKKLQYYGDSEDGRILCPNCEEDLWDLKECGFNVCPKYGQAIDWSEEE